MASQIPSTPQTSLQLLLAIDKSSEALDDRIHRAIQIIGLAKDWDKEGDYEICPTFAKRLVGARAEWVLRWILDKLKDETEAGVQARANAQAWRLVDWMVQVVPVSRAAGYLRDANFLTSLEKALQENFEHEATAAPLITAPFERDTNSSDSSGTLQEHPSPSSSKKRKRPSSEDNTPSKKVILRTVQSELLFIAMRRVLKCIIGKTRSDQTAEEAVVAEHMKMVLRTESEQAARILKFWLIAVQRILTAASHSASTPAPYEEYMDLSSVQEMWKMRLVHSSDVTGASADQFSAECLVPALMLLDAIQNEKSFESRRNDEQCWNRASQVLEELIARHIFAPSRTAFHKANAAAKAKDRNQTTEAKLLSSCLGPLQGKIHQAAEISDANAPISHTFMSLFRAIPRLQDLAIRISPSRTPKTRIAERPWIQAVFVVLLDCLGFQRRHPEFPPSEPSIVALEQLLTVLADRNIVIDSEILEDVFWYHSGVSHRFRGRKTVQWPVIVGLVKLDPDIFLPGPRKTPTGGQERPDDLCTFLFNQISSIPLGDMDSDTDDGNSKLRGHNFGHLIDNTALHQSQAVRRSIQRFVITPIMSSFSRNRDLLGFIDRFHSQLCESARIVDCKVKGGEWANGPSMWEDDELNSALAENIQSLTKSQLAGLLTKHQTNITSLLNAVESMPSEQLTADKNVQRYTAACGSSIILDALLHCPSYETMENLTWQLQELQTAYNTLVQRKSYRSTSDLALSWKVLARLLTLLWPAELHKSSDAQRQYLESGAVERALQDIAVTLHSQDQDDTSSVSRASTLIYLLHVCHQFQSLPLWQATVKDVVAKAIAPLTPANLETTDFRRVVEILIIEFPTLLRYFESETRKALFLNVLSITSDFEHNDETDIEMSEQLRDACTEFVFSSHRSDIKEDFSTSFLSTLESHPSNAETRHSRRAEWSYLRIPPATLPREQRKSILDAVTNTLIKQTDNVDLLLSLVAHLMQVPNSSAQISVDPSVLFDIAKSIHKEGYGTEHSTVEFFRRVVRLALNHIYENRSQPHNQKYLEKFKAKLSSMVKKPQKCFAAQLALVRANMAVQHDEMVLSWQDYRTFLHSYLSGDEVPISPDDLLDALSDIPSDITEVRGELVEKEGEYLRTWLTERIDMDTIFSSEIFSLAPFPLQTWLRLHRLMSKFRCYPDAQGFLNLALRLMREDMSAKDYQIISDSIREALTHVDMSVKLSLIQFLTQDNEHRALRLRVVPAVVSTLEDKSPEHPGEKQQALSILPELSRLVTLSSDTTTLNCLLDGIDIVVRDKPSLSSQFGIEGVLTAIAVLLSPRSPVFPTVHGPAIFDRLCETVRMLLVLHRGRVGGRWHLLIPVLQSLVLCFFIPLPGRGNNLPPWLRAPPQLATSKAPRLTPSNASHFAKLLTTVCSPTMGSLTRSVQKRDKGELTDPFKAARIYASQHISAFLSYFSKCLLSGRLDPNVREKLMPGMWEVFEVASIDMDGLQGMNAGMDDASREIWRGLWEEWKRVIRAGGARRTKERS